MHGVLERAYVHGAEEVDMIDGDQRQWLVKQVRWAQPVDQLGDAALVDVGTDVSVDEVRGRVSGEGDKLGGDCSW